MCLSFHTQLDLLQIENTLGIYSCKKPPSWMEIHEMSSI
jgi:hypothetical protein